jgi:hypothetical protein
MSLDVTSPVMRDDFIASLSLCSCFRFTLWLAADERSFLTTAIVFPMTGLGKCCEGTSTGVP